MPFPKLALLLAAALTLSGCATSPSSAPLAPAEPLPDARNLAEHPLDVINLPQP
jgi:uncharacterized lipoprotein YajG